MIKRLLIASSMLVASPLIAGGAAAASPWSDIGRASLPAYGTAELYVSRAAAPSGMMSGQLHAVLDQAWEDPDASGAYRDIYFRVLADCRDGTIAVQPSWPNGPDESSVPASALERPAPGTMQQRLLTVYCR